MGGVSRPDPWGIGQGVGAVGAVGSPAEVPQAPPRPEEAQAQATERGEGQACRHREDSKSPSYVYKLTHPRGWVTKARWAAATAAASGEAHRGAAMVPS